MSDSRYCSECNHAVPKVIIEAARFDFYCSNCALVRLSGHYSIGSMVHEQILNQEVHQLGLPRLPPPPLTG